MGVRDDEIRDSERGGPTGEGTRTDDQSMAETGILFSANTPVIVYSAVVGLSPPSRGYPRPGRVTKIAIDKRSRESENRGYEENRAGVLSATGRLRGEEAAGCDDPASHTEPDAATHCRTHRTLCSSQAGKCQHGDLQVSARNHLD
jgi:hypothetical protein